MNKDDIKRYKDVIIKKFKKELDANLRNLEDYDEIETDINMQSTLEGSSNNYRVNNFSISINVGPRTEMPEFKESND